MTVSSQGECGGLPTGSPSGSASAASLRAFAHLRFCAATLFFGGIAMNGGRLPANKEWFRSVRRATLRCHCAHNKVDGKIVTRLDGSPTLFGVGQVIHGTL